MNRLTWAMLIVACMLIGKKVLDSTAPCTTSSDPTKQSQERSETQEGCVTGIMHSSAKVSAIVSSRLVHEGDFIGDVKVVKIDKDRVHFQKLGIEWSQTVQDPPSKRWK